MGSDGNVHRLIVAVGRGKGGAVEGILELGPSESGLNHVVVHQLRIVVSRSLAVVVIDGSFVWRYSC